MIVKSKQFVMLVLRDLWLPKNKVGATSYLVFWTEPTEFVHERARVIPQYGKPVVHNHGYSLNLIVCSCNKVKS